MNNYIYDSKRDLVVITDSRGFVRVLDFDKFTAAADRGKIIDELGTQLLDAGWVNEFYRISFIQ